jgi:sphingomyelin phosphodiesterase
MQTDPNGQFTWLVNELQGAEDAGENVYIISHIPPGSSDYFHGASNIFNQIVNRYEATIAGMFYGHTHLDEFEISYSDYNNRNAQNAVAMSYITPSMTPTSGAPTFRVYSIDPVTYAILDFTDYTTDITAPSLVWKKYYSAKETYGALLTPPVTSATAELTPAFWHDVTAVFEASDAAFQGYYARRSRGFKVKACDAACKAEQICMMRAGESQYNCDPFKIGFNIAKRDEDSENGHHRDECEGTKVKEVFAAVGDRQDEFVAFINSQVAAWSNGTAAKL